MTRIDQALVYATQALSTAEAENPRVDARALLKHLLTCDDRFLFTYPEHLLTELEWRDYQASIERRRTGEPVAYITGQRAFWDFTLKCSKATLIPRPETELLVETGLDLVLEHTANVIDLGTGTGAIALALAKERPQWRVIGLDKIAGAVEIAEQNKAMLGLANVEFMQSDWFSAVTATEFNLIVSNPPYVEPDSPYLQQGDLRFEPSSALSAAQDGYADIFHIIEQAPDYLANKGWLMIEHGFMQAPLIQTQFELKGFTDVKTLTDLQQLPRVTIGRWHKPHKR